jgi:hypothetical protein
MTAVDGAARVPILEAIIRECAYLGLTVTWDEKKFGLGAARCADQSTSLPAAREDLIVDNRLRQILNHARKRSAQVGLLNYGISHPTL